MMSEEKRAKDVWGNSSLIDSRSLNEIMAEQFFENQSQEDVLASLELDINSEEDKVLDCSKDFEMALFLSKDPDCSLDEHIAKEMQKQFQHEALLDQQFEQSRLKNGVKKAYLSPKSFMDDSGATDDSIKDDNELEIYDNDINLNYSYSSDKHELCSFVPSKANSSSNETIDNQDPKQKLTARIFNDLKSFEKSSTKRAVRLKDKDQKALTDISIDSQTRLILLKWINLGMIDRVEEVIATGKESAVLHAILECTKKPGFSDSNDDILEDTHYAIKIYKTSTSSFKNRIQYVKDDFRFKNPRNVMKIWAEKELLNLKRLNRANIKCPTPLKLSGHALIMSMIGKDKPAPRLKEVQFLDNDVEKETAFQQVREIIIRLYKECKLVHADLSEFNLLYHDENVYVIDLAQAMDTSHPSSLVFLHRDIVNIIDFFCRIGCQDLPTPHCLFYEITGISFDADKNLLSQIESFETSSRGLSIREAKSNPADFELTLYHEEKYDLNCDPARLYN